MTNPNSECRNPNEIRRRKSDVSAGRARIVLGCPPSAVEPLRRKGGDLSPLSPLCRQVGTAALRPAAGRIADGAHAANPLRPADSSRPLACEGDKSRHAMSWRLFVVLFCFCILGSSFCLRALGQSYSIDWHTIDGGGGTSRGGVYSVSGTIGQSDASTTTMTGGHYSLTGGFWSLVAIQTPGAPTLKIVPAGAGMARISWSPNTPGLVLQETLSLSPTNWVNSASGTKNPVTVPVPGKGRFYRLFKP